MNSKELFEAWIKLQRVHYGLTQFVDGSEYTDRNTRIMWASWQASHGELGKQAN